MKPSKYVFSIEGSKINGLFVFQHEWSTGLLFNEKNLKKELRKYRQMYVRKWRF